MVLRRLLLLLAALLPLGCGDPASPGSGTPEGTLSRETFIATYVKLRYAALEKSEGSITAAERDSILAAEGVTPGQLFEFVEAHGRDLEYMAEVWGTVEQIISRGVEPEAALAEESGPRS